MQSEPEPNEIFETQNETYIFLLNQYLLYTNYFEVHFNLLIISVNHQFRQAKLA